MWAPSRFGGRTPLRGAGQLPSSAAGKPTDRFRVLSSSSFAHCAQNREGERLWDEFVGAHHHKSHLEFENRRILSLRSNVIVDVVVFVFIFTPVRKNPGSHEQGTIKWYTFSCNDWVNKRQPLRIKSQQPKHFFNLSCCFYEHIM